MGGTGKFSTVHLCWRRERPEKRYALKVICVRPDDHASQTRIYEEINILKVLGNHPSIIQLVDMDESQRNTIRLVLELCEGGELYDRIQQKQFYPEGEAKILIRNLLEACAFIHSKGIMHRDLKPENILLSSKVSNTEIKISDFGLAKISKDYPRRLPRSHSICGSDFYLAPEVIKQEEYGREIDIWSVGVVCYVILSGSLPFFSQRAPQVVPPNRRARPELSRTGMEECLEGRPGLHTPAAPGPTRGPAHSGAGLEPPLAPGCKLSVAGGQEQLLGRLQP